MKRIGTIEGIHVWVRWEDGHQVIVVEWATGTMGGWGLVNVVAGGGEVRVVDVGKQRTRAEVIHDDEVDKRIYALVDVLIGIRYAHPTMVQLPLVLSEEERVELTRILDL